MKRAIQKRTLYGMMDEAPITNGPPVDDLAFQARGFCPIRDSPPSSPDHQDSRRHRALIEERDALMRRLREIEDELGRYPSGA